MKLVSKFLVVLSILCIAACASSPKVQTVQFGDNNLSHQQIISELAKLDETERKIMQNKGLNGTNVAAFLFWLPGLAYTYYDATEAMKLVEQRRSHLTDMYNKKYGDTRIASSKT